MAKYNKVNYGNYKLIQNIQIYLLVSVLIS